MVMMRKISAQSRQWYDDDKDDGDGVPRSIAENRGVYKAHFAAIVRPSKIRR